MTTQATDYVQYQGQEYWLCNHTGKGDLFDPTVYGLNPAPPSTACYRGWAANYVVSESLVVRDLLIFHDAGLPIKNHRVNGPVIRGVAPTEPESYVGFNCFYKNLLIPVPFTGGMVIAHGFIRELGRNMPSHRFWKFDHVAELLFEEGRLMNAYDRSNVAAVVRQKHLVEGFLNRPEVTNDEAIRTQIEGGFSAQYEYLL